METKVKWEYKVLTFQKDSDIEHLLNLCGDAGWECFSIDFTAYGGRAFMKRINDYKIKN